MKFKILLKNSFLKKKKKTKKKHYVSKLTQKAGVGRYNFVRIYDGSILGQFFSNTIGFTLTRTNINHKSFLKIDTYLTMKMQIRKPGPLK